ncbi:diacylglycerol kinase [Planctomicrobium sp. SH664]|uniref:diacylglycerol kinase n=1 Tax=Planctomicrobium sp. SH664 TaxID=3448125 RepID=UPI003F5CB82F
MAIRFDQQELHTATPPRRSPWRQRLIDAERGFRIGLRADSTLFGYFFYTGIALLMATVVGLERLEWAILILCLGMSFAIELVHQLCKQLIVDYAEQLSPSTLQTLRLGSTAAVAAHVTAFLVTGILLWQRLSP